MTFFVTDSKQQHSSTTCSDVSKQAKAGQDKSVCKVIKFPADRTVICGVSVELGTNTRVNCFGISYSLRRRFLRVSTLSLVKTIETVRLRLYFNGVLTLEPDQTLVRYNPQFPECFREIHPVSPALCLGLFVFGWDNLGWHFVGRSDAMSRTACSARSRRICQLQSSAGMSVCRVVVDGDGGRGKERFDYAVDGDGSRGKEGFDYVVPLLSKKATPCHPFQRILWGGILPHSRQCNLNSLKKYSQLAESVALLESNSTISPLPLIRRTQIALMYPSS
ncbi:hypothetical protein K435DRAFT_900729 [Dendrothele bispora CBS 962.96]|uniref:Uncharacterized protein n=1 Tax=Dendrothele bispora (strain CBS 962.96) TaxID=1314807 RepID=A0A4S8KLI0_DENBC|nr:hypothetical protein K435DRAFT_900729 [Dendrothele bispora CBS 962.96]